MTQIVFHVLSSSWLCYDAASNCGMIDELERMWTDVVLSDLKYYRNICLEGLMETTRNLSQDRWCPG
jgi:hypothetical protein